MVRKYFSKRKDGASAITTQDFAYRFYHIVEDFVLSGYFYRLGMDYDYSNGYISEKMRRELAIAFGQESSEMIPTEDCLLRMNLNSIFDLIEFLSEHISKPLNTYDKIHVLEKWRKSVNECLEQLDPPYHLTADKEIETLSVSVGLQHLVDDHASPSPDAQERVNHACRLFLKRDATVHDKRSALKDLADVLEPLRVDLTAYIGKKDTDRLFDIANNYGIRHNNNEQKDLDESYMWWYFHSALSTIDLLARLGKSPKNQQK